MTGRQFYIVDVFGEKKYTGNQLAVFRDTASLSAGEMQQIAKEMNFSETTFLSDQVKDGGYDVRIFTPARELQFAGHPTLGTAFVIQNYVIGKPVETVKLNLGVGQITVTISYDGGKATDLWMRQRAPDFGETFDAATFAQILQVGNDDVDARFPVEDVSTGLPFVIVPLKSLDALKKAKADLPKYLGFVEKRRAKSILLFSPETRNPENNLSARVFGDAVGVPEDPATGSANGCLAAYLVKNRYFGKDEVSVRVEQGYEIGRPSLLRLRAKKTVSGIDVDVGGNVVPIAEGHFV